MAVFLNYLRNYAELRKKESITIILNVGGIVCDAYYVLNMLIVIN